MTDKWWEFDKHTMYELKWIIDEAKDLDRGKGVVDNFLDKDKVLVAFSRLDWAFLQAMFKDYDDTEDLEDE